MIGPDGNSVELCEEQSYISDTFDSSVLNGKAFAEMVGAKIQRGYERKEENLRRRFSQLFVYMSLYATRTKKSGPKIEEQKRTEQKKAYKRPF